MDIMTHAKFYFNRLMLTLIFAIRASEPPRAWRTTKKAGPDRVKEKRYRNVFENKVTSFQRLLTPIMDKLSVNIL